MTTYTNRQVVARGLRNGLDDRKPIRRYTPSRERRGRAFVTLDLG